MTDENKLESIIFGLKETIAEKDKEIERLTKIHDRTLKEVEELNAKNHGLNYAKAELQKQVDNLKAKNEHLDSENTRLICEMDKMLDDGWDIMDEEADGWYKKGGKDTAKEIIEELDLFFKGTTFRKGYEFKKINEKLKEIAKRKGVEVE